MSYKNLLLISVILISSFLFLGTTNKVEARTYCYNRYTGRFINWGSCHNYRRTYCHAGRHFLHWGACRYDD